MGGIDIGQLDNTEHVQLPHHTKDKQEEKILYGGYELGGFIGMNGRHIGHWNPVLWSRVRYLKNL